MKSKSFKFFSFFLVCSVDAFQLLATRSRTSSSKTNLINLSYYYGTTITTKLNLSSYDDDDDKEKEQQKDRKSSNLFVMEDAGSLISKSISSNTWSNLDPDKLKSNLFDGGGKVGEREEAWVAAAGILLISIFIGGIPLLPFINEILFLVAGPGLMLLGGAIILTSVKDLGDTNLTPFLSPTNKSTLITDGIYSKIRHPIYSGLIAGCAGFSIVTQDPYRLILTGLLIWLLDIKSNKEEDKLMDKFPQQYESYRLTTTGKFFPGDWSL